MISQQMVCVITPDWGGEAAAVPKLSALLDRVMEAMGCVHFASIAVLPPAPGLAPGSLPSLMLELAVDEGLVKTELVNRLALQGLEVLWPLYEGYAPPDLEAPGQRAAWLRAWLLRHTVEADGGYIGTRDRSVQQIHRERELYTQVRSKAAQLTANGAMESGALAWALHAWASQQEAFGWARKPAPRNAWRRGRLRQLGAVAGAMFVLLVCGVLAALAAPKASMNLYWQGPITLGLTLVFLVLLAMLLLLLSPVWLAVLTALRRRWTALAGLFARWDRARHARATSEVPRAHQVHPMVLRGEAELTGLPNHMISLTELRSPAIWHAAWLRMWLRLITWVGRWLFPHGRLGSAEGIRYGRWHLIDGGRRLLFCSNFDGSFGGYLGEFIAGATVGVNLFWRRTCLRPRAAAAPGHPEVTHARGFPPTRWLAWAGGCQFEQWFKTYARDSMVPHLYLYQAYTYSHVEVERATQLRDALFGPRNLVNDALVVQAVRS